MSTERPSPNRDPYQRLGETVLKTDLITPADVRSILAAEHAILTEARESTGATENSIFEQYISLAEKAWDNPRFPHRDNAVAYLLMRAQGEAYAHNYPIARRYAQAAQTVIFSEESLFPKRDEASQNEAAKRFRFLQKDDDSFRARLNYPTSQICYDIEPIQDILVYAFSYAMAAFDPAEAQLQKNAQENMLPVIDQQILSPWLHNYACMMQAFDEQPSLDINDVGDYFFTHFHFLQELMGKGEDVPESNLAMAASLLNYYSQDNYIQVLKILIKDSHALTKKIKNPRELVKNRRTQIALDFNNKVIDGLVATRIFTREEGMEQLRKLQPYSYSREGRFIQAALAYNLAQFYKIDNLKPDQILRRYESTRKIFLMTTDELSMARLHAHVINRTKPPRLGGPPGDLQMDF